jgi:hypothetical protein
LLYTSTVELGRPADVPGRLFFEQHTSNHEIELRQAAERAGWEGGEQRRRSTMFTVSSGQTRTLSTESRRLKCANEPKMQKAVARASERVTIGSFVKKR